MRTGVIGINHKLAGVALREKMAKACQRTFESDNGCVLLATCNRAEIYFSSYDLAESHSDLLGKLRTEITEPFDHKLYSYFGIDCFLHLARVTAGLDSAIVGESEIQRQVKVAYEEASLHCYLPAEMHYMFQKCLKIGKEVRTRFSVRRDSTDLESAVLQCALKFWDGLEGRRVLFVGASEVNDKVLRLFRSHSPCEIALCNRSSDRALQWADGERVHVCDWSDVARWYEYDIAIFGTRYPDYLITHRDLPQKLEEKKLVVDLSVPRNVDPTLGRVNRVTLLNIDQIDRIVEKRRRIEQALLIEMKEVVQEGVERQIEIFCERRSASPLQIVAAS
jgi:glutamyl-tRNA reductase